MRILVVEDEIKLANAIKRALVIKKYAVDAAYNGAGGLDLAIGEDYDLVILDILMEGITGDRVFATLRKDSRYKEVPIIMASALDEKMYRCFQALGNVSFLEKPFNKERLLDEITKRLISCK